MNKKGKKLLKKHFLFFLFLISFYLTKSNNKDIPFINKIINKEIKVNDIKNEKENLFGKYSKIIFDEKQIIELKTDLIYNASFLTYEVIPKYGKINVTIYENYNNINKNVNLNINDNKFDIYSNINDTKVTILNKYKSYFYTYQKNDTSRNKTLRIKCEEGLKGKNKRCALKVNIYTENDIINMNDPIIKDLPLFKYISKGNTNKYYFGNNTNNIYLIELFSGNISAEFKGSTKAISNKRFFNASNDNNLTIYGNEDSFYSIYDYSNKYINDNKFIVGSNYFLELKSGEHKTIKLLDCNSYSKNKTSYYIGIYSPEGDINLKFENPLNNQEIKQLKKNNYTQIILPSNLSYNFFLSNEIENINNIKVLLYNFDQNYGISLTNGFLQPFLFNKDDTLIFSYPHTEKDKYININFQLNQKEKYIVKIRLNNNEYKIYNNNNEYSISSDKKIF